MQERVAASTWMRPSHSAPINLQWGYDNRSCGLRVPISDPANSRIENRLPGADSNPYLAIAASLVCGYLGVRGKLDLMPMVDGNAYLYSRMLPRSLDEGRARLLFCQPAIDLLGAAFVNAFAQIKAAELQAFEGVISSLKRNTCS